MQKTKLSRLDETTANDVARQVDAMIAGERFAADLAVRGTAASLTLGMRYQGQGYETSVKLGPDRRLHGPAAIRAAFEAEYRRIFGLIFPDYTIEIVTWTVEISEDHALCELGGHSYEKIREGGIRDKGFRVVLAHRNGGESHVPVINRYALRPGNVITGDALVEEDDTTIYLPAGSRAVVSPSLDLIADLEAST